MSDELIRIEKKIDARFESFQKFLTGLSNKITAHDVEIDNCKEEKNDLKETLHGNGSNGLVLKVDRLETKIKITKVLKKGFWSNILTVFLCIGVVASIVLGILSSMNK